MEVVEAARTTAPGGDWSGVLEATLDPARRVRHGVVREDDSESPTRPRRSAAGDSTPDRAEAVGSCGGGGGPVYGGGSIEPVGSSGTTRVTGAGAAAEATIGELHVGHSDLDRENTVRSKEDSRADRVPILTTSHAVAGKIVRRCPRSGLEPPRVPIAARSTSHATTDHRGARPHQALRRHPGPRRAGPRRRIRARSPRCSDPTAPARPPSSAPWPPCSGPTAAR